MLGLDSYIEVKYLKPLAANTPNMRYWPQMAYQEDKYTLRWMYSAEIQFGKQHILSLLDLKKNLLDKIDKQEWWCSKIGDSCKRHMCCSLLDRADWLGTHIFT